MWYVVPNWHVYATYHFLAEPVCHLLARILLCQWSQVWTFQVWKHYFEQRCQFHSHILQWASPLYLQYTFLWWLWSLFKFKKSISFSRIAKNHTTGYSPSINRKSRENELNMSQNGRTGTKTGCCHGTRQAKLESISPGMATWMLSGQDWT